PGPELRGVGQAASWVPGSPVVMGPSQVGRPLQSTGPLHPATRPAGPSARPAGPATRSDGNLAPTNGQAAGRPVPVGQAERLAGVPACTSPPLRRFIKSRAYVPMHELRRRFAIEGQDDDVT